MRRTLLGKPPSILRLTACLCALVASAAVSAGIGVPHVIAFQGYLTDDVGVPIDDTVDLGVALYEDVSGGTALWSETHIDVLVTGGVFAIELGANVALPDSVFDRSELWLGVAVNGEGEMPRTRLRTSPFAFRALDADRLGGEDADAFVRAAGDSVPGVLRLEGGVAALAPSGGVTEVVTSTTGVLMRRYFLSPDAGSWAGLDGRVVIVVNGVPSGGAGVATITRNTTNIADVILEGSGSRPWTYVVHTDLDDGVAIDVSVRANSAASPVLVRSVTLEASRPMTDPVVMTLDDAYDGGGAGVGRSITTDAGAVELLGVGGLSLEGPLVSTAAPGDASVVLPDSSVSVGEILDESGLAEARTPGNTPITDSIVEMIDVAVVTVTTPADGYVVLEGTAQARFSASTTGNMMAVQIDEVSGGPIEVSYYHFVGWDSDSPAGESYQSVRVSRTYFKPAGTHTFRLEAMDHDDLGSKSLWNASLIARFHPTAYGAVEAFVPPGEGDVPVFIEGNGGPSGDVDGVDLRSLE